MSVAGWLIVRELRARWLRVALAGAVVAALTAAVTGMELLSLAREEEMAAQLDAVGPPLTVIPAGGTAGALARAELGPAGLPGDTVERVAIALGRDLRRAERRVLFLGEVAGVPTPVMGLEAWPRPTLDGVWVGTELAQRVGRAGPVEIGREPLFIAGTWPGTGGLEDAAALLPLERAGVLPGAPAGGNVLRVYLRSGVDEAEAAARLERALPGVAVVRHDRGVVASSELPGALAQHRALTYAFFALAGGLCLLISVYLDTAERGVELATLVAIGAPRGVILGVIAGRSVVVASAGAAVGVVLGAGVAAAEVPLAAQALLRHPEILGTPVLACALIALLTASPFAMVAALRDPVAALQEA